MYILQSRLVHVRGLTAHSKVHPLRSVAYQNNKVLCHAEGKERDYEKELGVKLSPEMLRIIQEGGGDQTEKLDNYEESLHSWWTEYAVRKNSESEEHVADGLLYDDRTHLPRTIPPPPCVEKIEVYRRSISSMSSMDLPIDFPRMSDILKSRPKEETDK